METLRTAHQNYIAAKVLMLEAGVPDEDLRVGYQHALDELLNALAEFLKG